MPPSRLWKTIILLIAILLPAAASAPQVSLYLPIVITPAGPPPTLTPFDASTQDLVGPVAWDTSYGKTPEIIVAANGTTLDVLAQDYDDATPWKAVLLHIAPGGGGYQVTQALTGMPMLDRVMGLSSDAAGNRYYATGVDEDSRVNATYPPLNTWRSDIVRVVKLDPASNVLFNIDLDTARHDFDPSAEMIINPMVAATARLLVGGNEIALVHGINTAPDPKLQGRRHQKALSTRLDAATGAVTAVSGAWVSHSFDQRLLYDGTRIIENHLGDAYPRDVVFAPDSSAHALFHIKGAAGINVTGTRLGNLATIANDPTYGYLGLFASESTPTQAADPYAQRINGPRNLAIVRLHRTDYTPDPSLPDTLTVTSGGAEYTNRLRWLTSYSAESNLHAERPKLVPLGGDQYIVLWEQWLNTGPNSDTFQGVYALRIDAQGSLLAPATLLTSTDHLPRGDDAFLLDGKAAWMTGSAALKQLSIHFVDAQLGYTKVTVGP